jgi:methionine-rich copper-binding protein CopC
MWINEIHYDNFGGDVDEFIEVVVENTFVGNLSDIEVVFYNGSNGNIISQSNPRTLDDFVVGASSGGFTIYSRILSSIQNGNPDGIALVNNGTVVEFLSYEGTLTANEGPAAGMTSTDIGVAEPGAIGESLQLSGTGNIPSYFTWQAPAIHTRGLINNGQTFADIPAHVISTFPQDASNAVESTTAIIIDFSEPINTTSTAFAVTCGAIIQSRNYSISGDLLHVTLTPNSNWPASSNCVINLDAMQITDTEGNNNQLDGNNDGVGGDNYSFSFNVASDSLPRFASSTPADQDFLVPVGASIDITFTENVELTASAITLNCPASVAFSGLPLNNISTVTITPTSPFSQGDICTVTLIGNQITDLDGDNDFLDGDEDGIAGGDYQFSFSVIEPIMSIYDIQGSGSVSPIADKFIRTQGNIVTALTPSGFFMQTADNDADASIDTSNGLFVFSNAVVAEGDSVDVRGKIVEFFDFTEMSFVSSVVVTSSSNALPTPIEFDVNTPSGDPSSPSCAIEFECYEGMLVHVASGTVNSGSQAFGADVNAEVNVSATSFRTMREPGIEFSRTGDSALPPFPTATYDPDIFDENPELFELDVDALVGMPSMEINGGATFSATGVLAYQFNDYELWPKQVTVTPRVFEDIRLPTSIEITIATQNMYRFFDGTDDPLINDFDEDNTTPAEFIDRSAQASLYFRTKMHSPDIIFLQEIENIESVQAIADKMNSDDPTHSYSAYLEIGNDIGGIDIGILTKETVNNITITQLGADETLAYNPPPPPELPRKLHDRPPLLINATITKGGFSQEVNVLGVHMRSRSGITGSQRTRIRNKHLEQSLSVANMVQNIQTLSPTVPLIITGDFNDFEFSDGYADVVGEIKGVVDPIKNLLSSNGASVVTPTLVNAIDTLPIDEKYSFVFRGTIQALDHMLINDAALVMMSDVAFLRGNVDSPLKYRGDYSQLLAMSDHDGLVLYLAQLEGIFSNGFE